MLMSVTRTLIMENYWLTIWEIADEIGISKSSANTILNEDLGM
jgi:predicted transcriptional regulator